MCAEPIRAAAVLCRYCGYDYRTGAVAAPAPVAGPVPQPASAQTGLASPVVVRTHTNGFAVASLVLGIVWLYGIGSVLALIFGFVGKSDIDRSGGQQSGRGFAIAGIVLGFVGIALAVAVIIEAVRLARINATF